MQLATFVFGFFLITFIGVFAFVTAAPAESGSVDRKNGSVAEKTKDSLPTSKATKRARRQSHNEILGGLNETIGAAESGVDVDKRRKDAKEILGALKQAEDAILSSHVLDVLNDVNEGEEFVSCIEERAARKKLDKKFFLF